MKYKDAGKVRFTRKYTKRWWLCECECCFFYQTTDLIKEVKRCSIIFRNIKKFQCFSIRFFRFPVEENQSLVTCYVIFLSWWIYIWAPIKVINSNDFLSSHLKTATKLKVNRLLFVSLVYLHNVFVVVVLFIGWKQWKHRKQSKNEQHAVDARKNYLYRCK